MATSQLEIDNENECAAVVENAQATQKVKKEGISRYDKKVWRWREKELEKLKTCVRHTEGDEVSGRSGG
jgi:hypothetical protein